MSRRVAVLAFLLPIFTGILQVYGNDQDFYFISGSPGGRGRNAGLYGGTFKPSESPNDTNLEQTEINEARSGRTYLNGFAVYGISYDPVSKKALVLLSNNLDNSLAIVDPCINADIKEKDFCFFSINSIYTGPFALYNSNVYFIAREARIEGKNVVLSLTIRKVIGCQEKENTFMDRDGFDSRECSTQVAKVLEEVIFTIDDLTPGIAKYVTEVVRTVGSKLEVVSYADDLYFLVQIAKPLYITGHVKEYFLDLFVVKQGGVGKVLQRSAIPVLWAGYIIDKLGDVSYKDGLLCWSAFESIYCGNWQPLSNLTGVQQVVKPGDAANVCTVRSTSNQMQVYKNIITGIDIVRAPDDIQIVFGCWAGVTSNGGAGYLTANKNWSDKRIRPIIDQKGRIFAGSLAVIDGCV